LAEEEIKLENTEDEGDLATISHNKELLYNLHESDFQRLKSIQEALKRMDRGEYGECVRCGEDINEKRLMAVAGITTIENHIEVLPLSTQDDRLRIASLRLIFGDSSLSRYGFGANPSIHVIVNNGRVTLKGVVANKLERQIAENVLRTNLLAFEVKNDLEVESM